MKRLFLSLALALGLAAGPAVALPELAPAARAAITPPLNPYVGQLWSFYYPLDGYFYIYQWNGDVWVQIYRVYVG